MPLLSVAKKMFYYFDNWCQCNTTFSFFTDDEAKSARVLVLGKHLQPSIIFASEARACGKLLKPLQVFTRQFSICEESLDSTTEGAFERYVGPGQTCKY